MGLIGKEIIQTTAYEDSGIPLRPKGNHRNIYPITVFEAVKETWENNAQSLLEIISDIKRELKSKQTIVEGKPANFLMTYGGIQGSVGSIEIGMKIPTEPENMSHQRIPTERAVGKLLMSLGLMSSDGTVNPDFGVVRWGQILGRPTLFDDLGDSESGVMTQRAVTREFNQIKTYAANAAELAITRILNEELKPKLDSHIENKNNPHEVTTEQIGAISKDEFKTHLDDKNNPHVVTKDQIGLGSVDNTSDMDKPVSMAARYEFETLYGNLTRVDAKASKAFTRCTYNIRDGNFDLYDSTGEVTRVSIPLSGTVIGVRLDKNTKELIIHFHNSVEPTRIPLKDIVPNYIAKNTADISTKIEYDPLRETHTISSSIVKESLELDHFNPSVNWSALIKGGSIGADSLANNAIHTEHIIDKAVTNDKIRDISIDKLKKENNENDKILLSGLANDPPIWGMINSQHIKENSITTSHIKEDSITSALIANGSITSAKIPDATINTQHLVADLTLTTPKLKSSPAINSNDNSIADTQWVTSKIDELNSNSATILGKLADIRAIVTPPDKDKVLLSKENNGVMWGQILGKHIANGSITDDHISKGSINADRIADETITNLQIANSTIDTFKMKPSAVLNTVLTTDEHGNVVFKKVDSSMLDAGTLSIGAAPDQSILLSKLRPAEEDDRVLITKDKDMPASWGQINGRMIENRTIGVDKLRSSPVSNRVLAVRGTGDDPEWVEVDDNMIKAGAVRRSHIANNSIAEGHIIDKNVTTDKIADRAITSIKIANRSIGRDELFTSAIPSRVLAITNVPYAAPNWLQVTTDMIEDKAISKEKFFRSDEAINPQRVLAVTAPGVPPEYIRITGKFIVDDSIEGKKLVRDAIFYGTPKLEETPAEDAFLHELVDAAWVRRLVSAEIIKALKNFKPNTGPINSTHKRFTKFKVNNVMSQELGEDEYISNVNVNAHPFLQIDPTQPFESIKVNSEEMFLP